MICIHYTHIMYPLHTHYATITHTLCIHYTTHTLFIHYTHIMYPLHTHYASITHTLCIHYTTHTLCIHYTHIMHPLYTHYVSITQHTHTMYPLHTHYASITNISNIHCYSIRLSNSVKTTLSNDLHSDNRIADLMNLVDSAPKSGSNQETWSSLGEQIKGAIAKFTVDFIPHMNEEEEVTIA